MMASSSNLTTVDQKLIEIIKFIDNSFYFDELKHIQISDIADDSRKVTPGALFIARAGTESHGERFIVNAINNGAIAVLRQIDLIDVAKGKNNTEVNWISTSINNSIPEIIMPFSASDICKVAVEFYKDPSNAMRVTAITGTNGKTSCAFILAGLINRKQKCGFIGTIGYGDINALSDTTNTSLGVIDNQKVFSDMYAQANKQIVMEVSSHALTQHRIDGVQIDCAVFTNLTHDHLDYHKSFENYGAAKLRLFKLKSLTTAVVNIDDDFSNKIIEVLPASVRLISYGIGNISADLNADILEYKINSTEVRLDYKNKNIVVTVPLLGKFNISNLLAVCAVLISQGMDLDEIAVNISDIKSVKGRMQCLGGSNNLPLVVVDYAHTPDALANVLKTLRQHCNGHLWCVFGCGGNRDKSKRAVMGEIASTLADTVVITNDNPRTEDPNIIANEIIFGIKSKNKVTIVLDRKQAIQNTIKKAKKSDVILIAGKGHEDYQIIDNIKYHFDDVNISLEKLNEVRII